MIKVWCSEMLDYAVDETVQVFGGSGYVEDYPAERYWRDARVNRIFEGTNEINRLLVPGRLLRRAMKGELAFFEKAMGLMKEVATPEAPGSAAGFLGAEAAALAGAKKVALMVLGLAAQRFGTELSEQQEVLGHFADIAMETYALESALLRARKKAAAAGDEACALQAAAVECFAQDALDRVEVSARRLLAALGEGDTLKTHLSALRRFTNREVTDTIARRRRVADAAIEHGGYPL
jgi:alkylation response protein AidB-like acyl-CoA dehydrogenase